ncbi:MULTISPECIES: S41 family peptidase [unclassified Mammaliicoccus]|uniref:S41 family peptidase n=1 Tax=unclassified Mammaliicoccus TaxID=2803851 RepID=UPI001EFB6C67|nr:MULTISPECIES: S41 family peptidase [unclassified Mammaliicoccus]
MLAASIRKVEELEEGEENDRAFIDIVQNYLLAFKDRHVFFIKSEESELKDHDIGFKVSRYEEYLVVTEVLDDNHLEMGQRIGYLYDISIKELGNCYQRQQYFETGERQKWNELLMNHDTFEIEGQPYTFRHFGKIAYQSVHKGELLNENTLMFTFTDFIDKVIDGFREEHETVENLIIDIRTNLGGNSFAYHNLLKYILPEGENPLLDDEHQKKFGLVD